MKVLFLVSSASSLAQERVQLVFDSSEAEAVLAILAVRAAGGTVEETSWQRLLGSEPYVRLKRREAGMKRDFNDADFRAFVLSDALLARRSDLERTLAAWKSAAPTCIPTCTVGRPTVSGGIATWPTSTPT